MTMTRQIVIAAVLMSMISASAAAQEWARFRGPNGAGQSDASTIPAKWSDDDYQWKIKLPGIGHASPVLWGDKLFIVSGDVSTGDQVVQCLNADSGKEIWHSGIARPGRAMPECRLGQGDLAEAAEFVGASPTQAQLVLVKHARGR